LETIIESEESLMLQFNQEKGFTLVEVMTSLVLILILILAFSGAFINGLHSETNIDDRLEATRITNSIIENLRDNRDDWESIDTSYDDFSIGFEENNGYDIVVKYEEVDSFENIYAFRINWEDRNYSSEIILAGE
jgi:prepilin-type N-terminal cleavage/methylation domain-containing protein